MQYFTKSCSLILSFLVILIFQACLETPDVAAEGPDSQEDLGSMEIAETFTFATSRNINFTVEASGGEGIQLRDVPLELFNGNPDAGGKSLGTAITNASGESSFSLELPIHIDTLYLATYYIGLPNLYMLKVEDIPGNRYVIGEESNDQVMIAQNASPISDYSTYRLAAPSNVTFHYMGSFDSQGDPDYLMEEAYAFTEDLFSVANASLPESAPVPTHNPQYIASGVDTDLKLSDSAEVIITFLHEGAGYKNAMGYYSYDLNNPPQSADDIAQLNIIFPNASYNNSGGGLSQGERVNLGYFPPNTGIGFFIVPNGWDSGSQTVMERKYLDLKYSNPAFNDFTSVADRSHTVLLNDEVRELLIIGMEDQNRPGGDKDFNDAIFVLHASPYSAIQTSSLAPTAEVAIDSDQDGVTDTFDDYPSDPNLAFNSYYPSENVFGTLMYEDLWPSVGDYDMNDMVIGYNYEFEVTPGGKVKNIDATFRLEAMGANLKNGFGIQLDVDPSAISQVTGSQLSENIITLASNGVEASQSKAVIIVFDNGYQIMPRTGVEFINTDPTEPYFDPVEMTIRIELTTPIDRGVLGSEPYNPFIFTDLTRGKEIHLADHAPTDLANLALFGTESDDSNPGIGRYYRTVNNGMWALDVPLDFEYPQEKLEITKGYTRLSSWTTTSGSSYLDWYSNASYRNYSFIYR